RAPGDRPRGPDPGSGNHPLDPGRIASMSRGHAQSEQTRPERALPGHSAAGLAAVVVGGGISGLLAARGLAKAGFGVTVLEASDAWGGCVGSHTVGGLGLDSGAESFATRSTAVADLARDLGLGGNIVAPHP